MCRRLLDLARLLIAFNTIMVRNRAQIATKDGIASIL
jgi:hypothetical protein